jgi:hypothetical protein
MLLPPIAKKTKEKKEKKSCAFNFPFALPYVSLHFFLTSLFEVINEGKSII